jgi:hypothetical protein
MRVIIQIQKALEGIRGIEEGATGMVFDGQKHIDLRLRCLPVVGSIP